MVQPSKIVWSDPEIRLETVRNATFYVKKSAIKTTHIYDMHCIIDFIDYVTYVVLYDL